jgi:hypothetical protein
MKVSLLCRKPGEGHHSIEGVFDTVREAFPPDVEVSIFRSRFESKGFFRRLYNCVEASFRQGDVNHIAGDVHYLSFLLAKNKTMLTILDCVFAFNTKGMKKYLLKLLWYVLPEKRVELISVISKSTKYELLNCITCNPEKVRVVPCCISRKFAYQEKEFNEHKPRILQVGTAANKNLERLFESLQGIPCCLDIVGKISRQQGMP